MQALTLRIRPPVYRCGGCGQVVSPDDLDDLDNCPECHQKFVEWLGSKESVEEISELMTEGRRDG